jgi:hypothetical protein
VLASVVLDLAIVKDRLEYATGLELELRMIRRRGGEFGVVIYLSALPDLGWAGSLRIQGQL